MSQRYLVPEERGFKCQMLNSFNKGILYSINMTDVFQDCTKRKMPFLNDGLNN